MRYVALMKAFGKAVRFYRNKLNVSQETLADRAELDRSYMSQIERGIKNATLNSIWRISQALGVSISDLLRLTEEYATVEAMDARGAQSGVEAAGAAAASAKVLIVDDDQDICATVESMLRDAGFQTLVAYSGSDALRIIANEAVDLVVSDIRMANGNGLELLANMREKHAQVPLFFITGYDDVTKEDAIARGANGLFHKPFDRRDFVDQLKSTLTPAAS